MVLGAENGCTGDRHTADQLHGRNGGTHTNRMFTYLGDILNKYLYSPYPGVGSCSVSIQVSTY